MLSPEEAADYLGISHWTLRKLVKVDQVTAYRVGRQLRFKREDLDTYLESVRIGKAPSPATTTLNPNDEAS